MHPALSDLEASRASVKLRVEADIRTGNLAMAAEGMQEVRKIDEQIHQAQIRRAFHLEGMLASAQLKVDELTGALAEMRRERDELETQVAWLENDLARDAE